MPHYVIKEKYMYPLIVYEAPVDEKTLQVRKEFDVDEKTGHQRHYHFRPITQLGPVYRPEDVFTKLGDFRPETTYSTKAAIVCVSAAAGFLFQFATNWYYARSIYAKPQHALFVAVGSGLMFNWFHEKTMQRSARKNGIYYSYLTQHPERFEDVHRPKFREVLSRIHLIH